MDANIQELVTNYHIQFIADQNHRNKSWEHCYSYFIRGDAVSNIDISSLHLSFYLASWGMYRGSSFLLWKDYRIHTEVVKKLLQNKELQQLDFSSIGDADLGKIIDLTQWIKSWYKDNIKAVNGKSKTINVTDTLVTKILLGTLGCIPAYDRYFIDGMRKSGVSYSRLNKSNFRSIIEFYKEHKKGFDAAQKTIYENGNVHYPSMKLIDMYFWQIGFQPDKSA